jgi:hypothetical protein
VRWFAPTKRHSKGGLSLFVNYRIDGRAKRFTIGSYPDWSAKAARAEAEELGRHIDRGEAEPLAARPAMSAKTLTPVFGRNAQIVTTRSGRWLLNS